MTPNLPLPSGPVRDSAQPPPLPMSFPSHGVAPWHSCLSCAIDCAMESKGPVSLSFSFLRSFFFPSRHPAGLQAHPVPPHYHCLHDRKYFHPLPSFFFYLLEFFGPFMILVLSIRLRSISPSLSVTEFERILVSPLSPRFFFFAPCVYLLDFRRPPTFKYVRIPKKPPWYRRVGFFILLELVPVSGT